jgi:DNA repair exonuclease SbcCD ATPase subunit
MQLQQLKAHQEAARLYEDKLMAEINSLILALDHQNTLVDELREKNASLSEQLKVSSRKQKLQNHEEELQNMKSTLEASRLNEEKLMVEISGLKLAQQQQNTLLDEHKKTIEELREKNASLSEQLRVSCQEPLLAQRDQNALLGHKQIIEELQKKNTNCSQLQKIPNNTTKDLTIRVGGSFFRVNRALFMARCPVIADLVRNNPENEMLTLKDVKESAFKAVHDYINTNQLPATADHLEVSLAAAKLKMNDLKKEASFSYLAIWMRETAMRFRCSK